MAGELYFSHNLETRLTIDASNNYKFLLASPPTVEVETATQKVDVNTFGTKDLTASNPPQNYSKNFRVEEGLISWTMRTPMLPYNDGGTQQCVEHILWENFCRGTLVGTAATSYTFTKDLDLSSFTLEFRETDIDYGYQLSGCVVNSVDISIDVDSLIYIDWGGYATSLEHSTMVAISDGNTNNSDHLGSSNYIVGMNSTLDFTSLSEDMRISAASISMNRNYTAVRFDELNRQNSVISFTPGPLEVTGEISGYLIGDGTTDLETMEFIDSIITNDGVIGNEQPLTINIGGTTADNSVTLTAPQVFLDSPTVSFDGVWSFTLPFIAENTDTLTSANYDTVTVTYN